MQQELMTLTDAQRERVDEHAASARQAVTDRLL
jgi:hypothetical protein